MKMTKQDYLKMSVAVKEVMNNHPGIKENYKKQGLSDMRFRWDMVHESSFDVCSLYHYLNDDHIDTALRKITGTK